MWEAEHEWDQLFAKYRLALFQGDSWLKKRFSIKSDGTRSKSIDYGLLRERESL